MLLTRIATNRILFLVINFTFWLLITVISATQLHIRFQDQYEGGWFNLFWRQSVVWLGWAILTPLIFFILKKLQPKNALSTLITHLLAALGFSFSYSFIMAVLSFVFFSSDVSIWEYTSMSLVNGTAANILVYLLIASFSWLLIYYHKSEQDKEKRYTLNLQVQSLEKQLVTAQLETLKSQIQPHFLFNALHSVASLIRKKELEEATEAIATLSDLLRATLKNQQKNLISLDEEIALVDKYLQIEKIRFREKIDIDFQLDPKTPNLLVPAFILQPLIENCFKHAFKNRASGAILIKSELLSGKLVISVSDNGEGICHESPQKTKPGLGVENVRLRLQNIYQNSAPFWLYQNETGGTTAKLEIPATND